MQVTTYSDVPELEPRKPYVPLRALQEAVSAWHSAVYPSGTFDVTVRTLAKLQEEVIELRNAGDHAAWSEECADVLICLCALASRLGVDLETAVKAKLEVVLARTPEEQQSRDKDRGI